MKPIEKRAREYVLGIATGYNSEARISYYSEKAFIAGAESERAELTRWHDPKEELPANDREVLCQIDCCYNTHIVLKFNDFGWWMPALRYSGWCACAFEVLAWREIL